MDCEMTTYIIRPSFGENTTSWTAPRLLPLASLIASLLSVSMKSGPLFPVTATPFEAEPEVPGVLVLLEAELPEVAIGVEVIELELELPDVAIGVEAIELDDVAAGVELKPALLEVAAGVELELLLEAPLAVVDDPPVTATPMPFQ